MGCSEACVAHLPAQRFNALILGGGGGCKAMKKEQKTDFLGPFRRLVSASPVVKKKKGGILNKREAHAETVG